MHLCVCLCREGEEGGGRKGVIRGGREREGEREGERKGGRGRRDGGTPCSTTLNGCKLAESLVLMHVRARACVNMCSNHL